MLKKTSAIIIAMALSVLFFPPAWCAYDIFLKIIALKSDSALVSAEGRQSHRIGLSFYPLPPGINVTDIANITAAKKTGTPIDSYPAFLGLAGQICHAMPGALDVQVDKGNNTILILFTASSMREWIESLVKELKTKLKEQRNIDIGGWEIINGK